jgi:hypothetical protein
MSVRLHPYLALLAAITGATAAQAQSHLLERWRPAVTLQTGFASTFQLTLGGTFGQGPAWQNRVVLDFADVAAKGDTLTFNGWMTLDSPSHRRDWTAAIGYRAPAVKAGPGLLTVTTSWQRWLFPSVLTGARDHLLGANAVYRTKWKFPITIIADDWVLLKSPLRRGNLTYVQASIAHQLWEGSGCKLMLRHGPATTYSYRFYDRPGWRVFRYGGGLALESAEFTLEGTLRQQASIAPRVPDNRYWTVLLSRRF